MTRPTLRHLTAACGLALMMALTSCSLLPGGSSSQSSTPPRPAPASMEQMRALNVCALLPLSDLRATLTSLGGAQAWRALGRDPDTCDIYTDDRSGSTARPTATVLPLLQLPAVSVSVDNFPDQDTWSHNFSEGSYLRLDSVPGGWLAAPSTGTGKVSHAYSAKGYAFTLIAGSSADSRASAAIGKILLNALDSGTSAPEIAWAPHSIFTADLCALAQSSSFTNTLEPQFGKVFAAKNATHRSCDLGKAPTYVNLSATLDSGTSAGASTLTIARHPATLSEGPGSCQLKVTFPDDPAVVGRTIPGSGIPTLSVTTIQDKPDCATLVTATTALVAELDKR
ncbi:hypothetical protein [Psychromicrobium xiongbiense]|uniref:hypothetical protein n=1 Tax=Psychromicrobium xiongbiense TaxID=3051184 RepID=UPI0025540055|nr:hypothetical protein [Psychromicrobium sp. YIM S02556]